jgi:hypothetical protein
VVAPVQQRVAVAAVVPVPPAAEEAAEREVGVPEAIMAVVAVADDKRRSTT